MVAGVAPGGSSGGFGCSDGLGSFGRLDTCDGLVALERSAPFAGFVAFASLVALADLVVLDGLVALGGLTALVGPDPFDGFDLRLPGFMGAFRLCRVAARTTRSLCGAPD